MSVPTENTARAARQAIDACADLTGRMFAAADAGDWDAVAELDSQRRPCFDGVDLNAVGETELTPLLERLRALVAMDGRLNMLADTARQSALEDLRKARGRVRGSARYEQLRHAR